MTDDVSSTIDILLVSGPSLLLVPNGKFNVVSAIGNQKIIVYSFFRENKYCRKNQLKNLITHRAQSFTFLMESLCQDLVPNHV